MCAGTDQQPLDPPQTTPSTRNPSSPPVNRLYLQVGSLDLVFRL